MNTYRVMTSTVSMGRRVYFRLDTIIAADIASAERIAARLHPAVSGYRTPWVEAIAPRLSGVYPTPVDLEPVAS